MVRSTPNNYSSLNSRLKLKRSQSVTSKASYDLYGALMMTEQTDSKGKSIKINKILSPNSEDTLTEQDKEKIFYVVDYLRIAGVDSDDFKKLTMDDFTKIKELSTPKDRADMLVSLIIEKSGNGDTKYDILEHANAMVDGKNAEIVKRSAERLALKKLSTNRFRYYGAKIRDIIDENTDDGKIDWKECYLDVIKYANYSSINLLRRAGRTVPAKFGWFNIPKQTQKTLDALRDQIKLSDNDAEVFAIEYIRDKLHKAFSYYKTTIGPSDAVFDQALFENENIIYSESRDKKKNGKNNGKKK